MLKKKNLKSSLQETISTFSPATYNDLKILSSRDDLNFFSFKHRHRWSYGFLYARQRWWQRKARVVDKRWCEDEVVSERWCEMGLSASGGASMGLSASADPNILRRESCEFVESGESKGTKPLGLARGRCRRRDLAVEFRSLAIVHRFEFG